MTAVAEIAQHAPSPIFRDAHLRPGERIIELRCIDPEHRHNKTYVLHLEDVGGVWQVHAYWGPIGGWRQDCVKFIGLSRGAAVSKYAEIVKKKKRPHRKDRNYYTEFCKSDGEELRRPGEAPSLPFEGGNHVSLGSKLLDRIRVPARRLYCDSRLR